MASTTAQTSVSRLTTGAGDSVDFLTAKSRVSAVVAPTGTITGGVVAIEVSHDGTTWVKQHVLPAVQDFPQSYDLPNGAYRYWRGNVLSPITGGGDVTVTFMEGNA